MSLAKFMLRNTARMYQAQMNKLVKNKFRPVPELVEAFNYNSSHTMGGIGFPYYKDLIQEAWHPVTQAQNHKIVVWDVIYVFSEASVTTSNGKFILTICNRLTPSDSVEVRFDDPTDRLAYIKECKIFFDYAYGMVYVKQPDLVDFKKRRNENRNQFVGHLEKIEQGKIT